MTDVLYVVEFSTGVIKVGRSKNYATRLGNHRAAAQCFGATVANDFSVSCHDRPVAAERALLDWCAQHAVAQQLNEWFVGLSFDAVCAQAAVAVEMVRRGEFKWDALDTAVSLLGSQSALAARCSVVQGAVSNWKLRGRVPREYCPIIESATDGSVTCEQLRPDVDWSWLRGMTKAAV